MYGYKSLKWLGGIELTDADVPGYWEVRGYDVDAWVGIRTDVTMLPSDHGDLPRFTRAERWAHRATGLLMGVCSLTAAVLHVGPLSVPVGRRDRGIARRGGDSATCPDARGVALHRRSVSTSASSTGSSS